MRSIAIMNQKGGSAKTTTTVSLAAALAETKRRILVIDLDPQASTSSWFGCPTNLQGLLEVLTTSTAIESIIVPTKTPGVHLIPGSSWLIGLEKKLAHEVGAETILKHKFKDLDASQWDYILIDCPPALSLLTINALSAVTEVIIPIESRIMALQGLVHLLQTIDVIKQRLNSSLRIAGIVACRIDTRTKHSKEVVDELRKNFGSQVYKTAIRENIRLAEAPSFAQSILLYSPESSGAQDYRAFAQEVIAQEPVKVGHVVKNRSKHKPVNI